jgi:teichoic acid transport system ATP-binding protein
VVVVDDVHVTYRVYEDRQLGLYERVATRRIRRPYREVHAVKGVSFTLYEGDALGIVGTNGSGKSTLLSAMTGLLPVDSGTIRVSSRPTLLGVGAALRQNLSGRRNIVLGCLAAGLTRAEIAERIDDIIEFSGLTDFIDMPMRAYSSGMRARLTFSIATARTPEILLIDEALAVGDQAFKTRSSERVTEIRESAGAVVIVSHNLNEIEASCNRAMWLDQGVQRAIGDPVEVVEEYLRERGDAGARRQRKAPRSDRGRRRPRPSDADTATSAGPLV